MARSTSLPAIASGEGGLNRYLQEIRLFPMLAPEEEFMLTSTLNGLKTNTFDLSQHLALHHI